MLVVLMLWGMTQVVFAQSETSLESTWINEAQSRKVEFYQEGKAWFGKLIWVQGDSKAKTGDILFRDLVWDGRQFSGKAMTPRGILNCRLSFEGEDKIKINATKAGMSKAVYWSRVK